MQLILSLKNWDEEMSSSSGIQLLTLFGQAGQRVAGRLCCNMWSRPDGPNLMSKDSGL